MLQVLLVEKAASKLLYYMVSGIFSFVAKIYDMMLKLAGMGRDTGSIEMFYFSDLTTAMYTIAGVFMLFRVTISAINMIINPDMVSDGNKGAGKILTRIVTSLAMLIMFAPTGWIFGEGYILDRLEKALLAEDGLINKLIPDPFENKVDNNSNKTAMNTSSDGLVANVHAAGSTLECYYVNIVTNDQGKLADSKGKKNTIKAMYHITFYDNTGKGKTGIVKGRSSDLYSYTSEDKNGYDKFSGNIAGGEAFTDGSFPSRCPKLLDKVGLLGTGGYQAYMNYSKKSTENSNADWNTGNGIRGGWSSESDMKIAVGDKKDDFAFATDEIAEMAGEDSYEYLSGVEPEAVTFAQNTMGVFISCNSDGDNEECKKLKNSSLISTLGDDKIVDNLADEKMHLDFLPAIVSGIGIAGWVLVLCVDIIVRRFKLMLLQIMAPIPIISYIDPNDKKFNDWAKMYIGTYADLFIKLIAISIAISLLKLLWHVSPDSMILEFFYIVAILVFAKMIPSMISELLGIKGLGGSFKDITGMGKAALGFGAGAAIGTVGGALSGVAAGAAGRKNGFTGFLGGAKGLLTGAATGALRGAGAGTKGNLTGGAKSAAASNYRAASARMSGLTTMDLMLGQMGAAVGYNPKTKLDMDVKKYEGMLEMIGNVQNGVGAMDKSLEGTAVYQTLVDKAARGEMTRAQLLDAKKSLAAMFDKGTYTGKLSFTLKDGSTDSIDFDEKGYGAGYTTAKVSLNNTLKNIKSSGAASVLEKEGVKLIEVTDYTDAASTVKGSTFNAQAKFQREVDNIKSSAEYHKADTIEQFKK